MSVEEELTIDSLSDSDRNGRTSLVEIKEYIDCHYKEAITIGQLARMANICPKYFVDLFKKTFSKPQSDVIIGMDHLGPEEITKLEHIAPTLIVPSRAGWRKQLERIATFLNKEEQAQSWIEQYERRVQFARSRMRQVVGGERVVALRIYG